MHQNLTSKKISAVGFFMMIIFSVILSWKLFRLIVPIQYFWNMHNYLIILFAILSLVVGLRYSFYLQKSRTSMAVLIFIGLSLVRLGYFHESQDKGNRQYFTLGGGFKTNALNIDLSYLINSSDVNNPLENSLRFSLSFDLGEIYDNY